VAGQDVNDEIRCLCRSGGNGKRHAAAETIASIGKAELKQMCRAIATPEEYLKRWSSSVGILIYDGTRKI
jgi:hypothetical protein